MVVDVNNINCFFKDGVNTNFDKLLPTNKKAEDKLDEIKHQLHTFRVDIKNIGTSNNGVTISANGCKITTPSWAKDEYGQGVVIESVNLHQLITIKIINDGRLRINFRGKDKRCNNERFPIWIDYKSIQINGKEILYMPVATWHDEPYHYEISVKDKQEITLEIEQQYHQYTEAELVDTLLKLDIQCDIANEFLEYYKNTVGFKEVEYNWRYVKNHILTQKKQYVQFDNISSKTQGLLQIAIGNTKFESVLIPSKTKKLYVFLAGYNDKNEQYPAFARISWCDKFDGMVLCFDDPTRIEKNYSPSYYFGSKEENYLQYVYRIVKKIIMLYEIKNENVTFIGSSHTGFCSLYLANELLGSRSIALNPQIDIETLKGKSFADAMKISYTDSSIADRINVLRILNNTVSSFFIFSNLLSGQDKKQMELLHYAAHKKMSLGISQLSATTKCLLAEIPAVSPHHAQPDEYFCRMIETIIDKPITPWICDLCNCFVGEMKRYYAQNKELVECKKDKTI